MSNLSNKKKIINDPVYGFINVESNLIFDLIEHPWFQRLRRIKQLGLTDYVYPGAIHSRFHHALGAMHLMGLALQNLRLKGNVISEDEYEAAQAAILLHDIGHGPFSHALEYSILSNTHHEAISLLLMEKINVVFHGKLDLAIKMFTNQYERKFFHDLISGQLDIDRLDYLKRDGFYTGVSEGTIGSTRLIKLLQVHNNELVIEEKGIYSIEHFLIARRVMYWQVYLHKTTVCAEKMLISAIKRARDLAPHTDVSTGTPIDFLLKNSISDVDLKNNSDLLNLFTSLDDNDVWVCLKKWSSHADSVLKLLCISLLNRNLFKINILNNINDKNDLDGIIIDIKKQLNLNDEQAKYLILTGILSNEAYVQGSNEIKILLKNGIIMDLPLASDLPNIQSMSKIVTKYYVCSPKIVTL